MRYKVYLCFESLFPPEGSLALQVYLCFESLGRKHQFRGVSSQVGNVQDFTTEGQLFIRNNAVFRVCALESGILVGNFLGLLRFSTDCCRTDVV